MKIVRTIAEVRHAVREAGARGATIGFVPTMGAFHDGHLSLMRTARAQTGFVVVSVFVNPSQFNDPADLAAYPRDEARDAGMAAAEGVDRFFAPDAREVYPEGFSTAVSVAGLSEPLCGKYRGPEHFRGVATVVAKLLNIVTPDVAYFGQKDAQQAVIVRRLVRDLDLAVRVEVCPTVRESDGLAMSSRNARLGAADRSRALALRQGLAAAEAAIARGLAKAHTSPIWDVRRCAIARRRARVSRNRLRRDTAARDSTGRRSTDRRRGAGGAGPPDRQRDDSGAAPMMHAGPPVDGIARLAQLKRAGTPIVMVTAYDIVSARVAEAAEVDIVLVGDSAANVVLGYASTRECRHGRAARVRACRATRRANVRRSSATFRSVRMNVRTNRPSPRHAVRRRGAMRRGQDRGWRRDRRACARDRRTPGYP